MTSRQTLETLLQLLIEAESQAAKALGEATQRLSEAEEKRQMLEQFRTEYQERLRQALIEQKPPELIANYHQFLQRLEEAIAIQAAACEQAAMHRQQAQQTWQTAMGKRKAFELLLAKEAEKAAVAEAKSVQKLLDEWATQRHHRTTDEGGPPL